MQPAVGAVRSWSTGQVSSALFGPLSLRKSAVRPSKGTGPWVVGRRRQTKAPPPPPLADAQGDVGRSWALRIGGGGIWPGRPANRRRVDGPGCWPWPKPLETRRAGLSRSQSGKGGCAKMHYHKSLSLGCARHTRLQSASWSVGSQPIPSCLLFCPSSLLSF